MVGPLPILNALAHEFESLRTVILRCKVMTMLQWAKTEGFKSVIVVLGGFHTQMTLTKVIEKYLEPSGILDIWAESEVFGENYR